MYLRGSLALFSFLAQSLERDLQTRVRENADLQQQVQTVAQQNQNLEEQAQEQLRQLVGWQLMKY